MIADNGLWRRNWPATRSAIEALGLRISGARGGLDALTGRIFAWTRRRVWNDPIANDVWQRFDRVDLAPADAV
ncbi:hypothetical protein A9K65_031730 [Mesorhizobium sp. WSM1497]|nr:hypothetical protein A9K65_031730 [Mesorhizobium sp. WSM1497]PBC13187.1 hypothetical protein CK225_28160 [Mesorhizobium loti]